MKKIRALKWLWGTKNVLKPQNHLSKFDNKLSKKWEIFFSQLPFPHTPLEIGSYSVFWNSLLRSRAGLCKPHLSIIELNPHLLITAEQIEKTLVHELCHLSISRRFWRAQPHGTHWKKLMVYCGFEPERCHKIEGTQVYRQKRLEVICKCRRHMVTSRTFNKIQRGIRYNCRSCQTILITPS